MTVEAIGTGLKGILDDISGLRVFAPNELPDTINEFPAAVIVPGEVRYHADFAGDYDFSFRVIILLTSQDKPTAFDKILPYIEASGASSVLAKIDADPTLGGTCDTCQVTRNTGVGVTSWGGVMYLSTEFEVAIWA